MLIILCGFKGCGKSTVGKKLAESLKLSFEDIDTLIEKDYAQHHAAATGQTLTVRQIYKALGEPDFRKLEEKILAQALALQKRKGVLALGGGSIVYLNQLIAEKRAQRGNLFVVYLQQNKELLYGRIMKGGMPAFFDSHHPRQSFEERYGEREPLYRKLADVVVSGTVEDGIVAKIVAAVRQKVI